jgi:hypothetical protein
MVTIVERVEEISVYGFYLASLIFARLRDRIIHVYTHVRGVTDSIVANVSLDTAMANPYTLLAYRFLLLLLMNMFSISSTVIGQLWVGNADSFGTVLDNLPWNQVEIKAQLFFGILFIIHDVQTEEVFFSTYAIMGVVLQTMPGYFVHVLALVGMCWGMVLATGALQSTLLTIQSLRFCLIPSLAICCAYVHRPVNGAYTTGVLLSYLVLTLPWQNIQTYYQKSGASTPWTDVIVRLITIPILIFLQTQRLLELMYRPNEVDLLGNVQFLVNIGLFYRMRYFCQLSKSDHQTITVLVAFIGVVIIFDWVSIFRFILVLLWIGVILKTISRLVTYLVSVGYIILFMRVAKGGEYSSSGYRAISLKSVLKDFRRKVINVILGRAQ